MILGGIKSIVNYATISTRMSSTQLNKQQLEAVNHLEGPALVVAGPGSGKTRVLTHRIANLIQKHNINALNILCVTFTNKAAGEIKTRAENLIQDPAQRVSWSGTFHSVCSKILRKDGFNIEIPMNFVIYDTDDQADLIKQIEKDFGIDPKKFAPKTILGTISNAKSELVSANEYSNVASGYYQKTVSKIFSEYQKRLRANNALDFDDLLVETVNLFKNAPEILEKYQNIFQFILIDEYQDTNRAQYVITKLLAEKNKNIFVVGDMAQAIYRFRGADYRNILNFQRDYPSCKIYNLEQNYRSTQNILDAAKNVIKNNSSHIELDLWTDKGTGEKIISYTGRTEKDEAQFVVDQVLEEISNNTEFNEIGILYRTNAQSRNIEDALIKNNIPYRIIGGLRFYARKEIKDVIAYLKVIHNPKDSVSWERIINTPPRGIGQKSVEKLKENKWNVDEISQKTNLPFNKWILEKENYSTVELIDEVLHFTKYIEWLSDKTEENMYRIENIKELRSVANEFPEIDNFLENVALIESTDRPKTYDQNAVTLMTVHASKGLEFKTVFIIGMEEGLFPHMQSMGLLEDLEEERRLCYVAMTRAMERLYITLAQSRMYFGNINTNMPSRFLNEIPTKVLDSKGIQRSKAINGFSKKFNDDEFFDALEYNRNNFNW